MNELKIGDTIRCSNKDEVDNMGVALNEEGYRVVANDNTLVVIDQPRMSVMRELDNLTEVMCDNFCKYRDTCDDDCECEWTRNFGECPLNRL